MGSCVRCQAENAFSIVREIEDYIDHAEQVSEGIDGVEQLELKMIVSEMRRCCVALMDMVTSRIVKRPLSDRDVVELFGDQFDSDGLQLMRMEDYEAMQAHITRQTEEIAALDKRVKQLLEN